MRSAHPHPILNNVIKGVIFVAFFLAGLIYGYSINLNTMQEQHNQITVLERQTKDQQRQIDDLLRHKEEAEAIKKILLEHENRLKHIENKLK